MTSMTRLSWILSTSNCVGCKVSDEAQYEEGGKDDKWNSRKLRVAVWMQHYWIAMVMLGVYFKEAQSAVIIDAFVWLTAITIGGYLASNVGDKFAQRRGPVVK